MKRKRSSKTSQSRNSMSRRDSATLPRVGQRRRGSLCTSQELRSEDMGPLVKQLLRSQNIDSLNHRLRVHRSTVTMY
ncbi:hypothetical protein NDU88_007353 [Pleurodeles waltl]|uniref:Uncharacterized protein n=1 Tax=Pleurodeles waltl TaxID=8319 RepID=A0AAV7LRU3_PLEWA|nr:hypothetical protein NDU88_007353 [Pleurodeles waltl]